MFELPVIMFTATHEKIKMSHYTPWRRWGEEK
jgi:hypothetical protein